MPNELWKSAERGMAQYWGAKRSLMKGLDVEDFISGRYNIIGETKHRKKLPKWIHEAVAAVEKAAAKLPNLTPIVCLHEFKQGYADGSFYVLLRARDLKAILERGPQ